jgi:hypothetical protein
MPTPMNVADATHDCRDKHNTSAPKGPVQASPVIDKNAVNTDPSDPAYVPRDAGQLAAALSNAAKSADDRDAAQLYRDFSTQLKRRGAAREREEMKNTASPTANKKISEAPVTTPVLEADEEEKPQVQPEKEPEKLTRKRQLMTVGDFGSQLKDIAAELGISVSQAGNEAKIAIAKYTLVRMKQAIEPEHWMHEDPMTREERKSLDDGYDFIQEEYDVWWTTMEEYVDLVAEDDDDVDFLMQNWTVVAESKIFKQMFQKNAGTSPRTFMLGLGTKLYDKITSEEKAAKQKFASEKKQLKTAIEDEV